VDQCLVSCLLTSLLLLLSLITSLQALLTRAEDLFGITNYVLLWLSSFLAGRQSFVSVGDYHGSCTTSPPFPMNHGVPQGSTLGSILFAMYVAPLKQVVLNNGARCHQ